MIFLGGLAYLGMLNVGLYAMELPPEQSPKRQKQALIQQQISVHQLPTLKARALEVIAGYLETELNKTLPTESFFSLDGKKFFKRFSIDRLPDELKAQLLDTIVSRVRSPIYHAELQPISFSPTGHKGLFRCQHHNGFYVDDLFGRPECRRPSSAQCCFPSFSEDFAVLSHEGAMIFAWRKNQVSKTEQSPTPTIIDTASGTMYDIPLTYGQHEAYGVFIASQELIIRTPRELKKVTCFGDKIVATDIYTVPQEKDSFITTQVHAPIGVLSDDCIVLISSGRGTVDIFSPQSENFWVHDKTIELPNPFGRIYGIWGKKSILWCGFQRYAAIDTVSGASVLYVPQSDYSLSSIAWADVMGEKGAWLKKLGALKVALVESTGLVCLALKQGDSPSADRYFMCYPSPLAYLFCQQFLHTAL